MVLERIIWKDDNFVKESDGSKVNPKPIGPLFNSYHPEGDIEYESQPGELTDFYEKSAEYHIGKAGLHEVNAFQGSVILGDGGGEFAIIQLYRI